MRIVSQTPNELAVHRPMDKGMQYVKPLYISAAILPLVAAICAWLSVLYPENLKFLGYGFYLFLLSPILVALGLWTYSTSAAVLCTFDRARGVVDVVRTRGKSEERNQYALTDISQVDVEEIEYDDATGDFEIRLHHRQGGKVKLGRDKDETTQRAAAAAINDFLSK